MAAGSFAGTNSDGLGRRERILWSLFAFVFALGLRAVLLWQLSDSALFQMRMGDGRVYHLWAERIAAGDWIGDEVFFQAPLYPYFLAVLYWLIGPELITVRLAQIVIGAASCLLLTQAGWRLFSKPVGIAAGVILALYAPALFSAAMIQKSVLDIFFVCTVLWLMGLLQERYTPKLCLGLGLSIGALILTRENALVTRYAAIIRELSK